MADTDYMADPASVLLCVAIKMYGQFQCAH